MRRGGERFSRAQPAPTRHSFASLEARPDLKVTFIIPAYNEAATVGVVIERVQALPFDKQVIEIRFASGKDLGRFEQAPDAGRRCEKLFTIVCTHHTLAG